MTRWLTADEHYRHKNIIRFCGRPFVSVGHMEAELILRHNLVVGDDDDVFHLGDFSMDERIVTDILAKLHGRHHLIAGNHDACHPCHKRHAREARRYLDAGFVTVQTFMTLDIEGFGSVDACHLPYSGDHKEKERYIEFRPKDEGRFLLHGHVHEHWLRRERMLNVGVDVHDFAPVSETRVAELLHRT